jgi:zinc protease
VRLAALKMTLPGALEIFADVALHPSFPGDMVEIARKRTIAAIGQEKANPQSLAFRIVPLLLYGPEHGYGNPATGSGYEKDVAGLTGADLTGWHQKWFVPNNATLVVAGDTTLGELVPQLEEAFGSWTRGEAPDQTIDEATSPSAGKVYLIDKPGAPQSVIVAAHLSRPGGQPEDLAIETVMRNFGGMSTSRLNRNLRLDKHWSYGSQGFVLDARGQRPFMVVAPVQSDKTREAMVEVVKEIRGVAGERPVTGEECHSIMRNMVLRLPGRFETLSSLESAALDLVNFGYPPEYYYDYARNVRALSEADLAVAAAKFVTPDELTWLIVGDLASVEAGIRDLGYGEIVRLDPDGRVTESAAGRN